MSWQDFVPAETLKALCRHTIASGFAIGCFALTGTLASKLFPDEPIKSLIHWVEYIGILSILVFLIVEFFREIIKGKGDGKDSGK